MPIRTAIVDDEPHARSLLRLLLSAHRDVEVTAEYGGGSEALREIAEERPDLVLLDIQMPGLTGLQLAEALRDAETIPCVVFVTAYDEYAIRAFEVHALDYILKPVAPERLAAVLDRVRAAIARGETRSELGGLQRLLDGFASRERRIQRLAIRVGDRTYLQRVEDIEWVEADGKQVRVHVNGKTHAMRETMKSMEARLDAFRFVRISRSAIVNLDRIREIQPWFNGELVVIMDSGAEVTTTRGYREQLRELIGRHP